jgi:hypothetical protein
MASFTGLEGWESTLRDVPKKELLFEREKKTNSLQFSDTSEIEVG